MKQTLEERFWSKVDKTEDCWLWRAGKFWHGYGQFSVNNKSRYAHRVAYELEFGPVPDGMQLDHLCRVRLCVRPSHLEAVTQTENIRRGVSPTALNRRLTKCKRGHDLSGDNIHVNARGYRQCRVCRRITRALAKAAPEQTSIYAPNTTDGAAGTTKEGES